MTKEKATALREAYCTMRDIIIDIPDCKFCPFNDGSELCNNLEKTLVETLQENQKILEKWMEDNE